jgi:hypothetical protein
MDAGQVLRGLRAAVFAAVCVLLAALGHVVMSATAVPWWTLLTALVSTTAGAWFLAGRERGPLLVALLTVGTQAALHSAFSFGQAAAASGADRRALARQWAETWMCGAEGLSLPDIEAARHLHDAMPGMSPTAPHGSVSAMHAVPGGAGGMLAAHLLVALLSAWWLWGGERAAFRVVRALSARLFAPLVLVLRVLLPTARPRQRRVRPGPRRALRTLLLAHTRSLRGPPRGPAVV